MVAKPSRYRGGEIGHWLAAVNATPEDGWIVKSDRDYTRAFRRARLTTTWERERGARRESERRAMFQDMVDEVEEIAEVADGLTSYEVAAILRRSVWTARRFIRRVGYRQRVGPCPYRWTGRYVFGSGAW